MLSRSKIPTECKEVGIHLTNAFAVFSANLAGEEGIEAATSELIATQMNRLEEIVSEKDAVVRLTQN